MFTTSRRPVPSSAALRILRQLAYISSGTVCGAAALVAEERRRQTRLAGKIVENSRRLKQHPRYAHSAAALAAVVPSHSDVSFFSTENDWIGAENLNERSGEQDQERKRKQRRRNKDSLEGKVGNESNGTKHRNADQTTSELSGDQSIRYRGIRSKTDVFKNHLLPSEVEKDYDKYNRRRSEAQPIQRNKDGSSVSHRDAHHSRRNHVPYPTHPTSIPGNTLEGERGLTSSLLHISSLNTSSLALQRDTSKHASNRPVKKKKETHDNITSLSDSCRALLRSGNHNVARLSFVRSLPELLVDSYEAWLPLAQELFDACLANRNLASCEALLLCMDGTPNFESNLHTLLTICADIDAHKVLYRMSAHHRSKWQFPSSVYPAVCRSYAKCANTSDLREFIHGLERPVERPTLDACQPAWALLLRRRWHDTGSLDAVKDDFDRMRHLLGDGNVDIVLYNAIIRACIEAGKPLEAEILLRQMHDKEGVLPDLSTFAYFVLSAAKARAWDSVESMMGMFASPAVTDSSHVDRAALFNPILSEYARHHQPTETWSFASAALEVQGISPNRRTSDSMLEHFVHKQRLDLVPGWLQYMQACGLETRLDHLTVTRVIRRYYYDMRPSHIIMLWLCRNLSNYVPGLMSKDLTILLRESIAYDMRAYRGSGALQQAQLASLRLRLLDDAPPGSIPLPMSLSSREDLTKNVQAVGTGPEDDGVKVLIDDARTSFGSAEHGKQSSSSAEDADSGYASDSVPETYMENDLPFEILNPKETSELHNETAIPQQCSESGDNELPTRIETLLDQSSSKRQSEIEILVSLSLGQPSEAVALYKRAIAQRGAPHSSYSLEMAIAASLSARDDDASEAEQLFNLAEDPDYNITGSLMPLVMQRITRSDRKGLDPEGLLKTVIDFYRSMDQNGIPVRHHIATTAASILIRHKKSAEGVSLLRRVFSSPWGSSSGRSFDIVAMTVFLQGYTRLERRDGIEWVIDTVLEKNLRIDDPFLRVLKVTHKNYQRRANLEDDSAPRRATDNDLSRLATDMAEWLRICKTRRAEQIKESKSFGNSLVRCIIKATRRQPAVEVSKSAHTEAALFRRRQVAAIQSHGAKEGDDAVKERMRVAKEELVSYRATLRAGLRGKDGKRLRFRYALA